MHELGLMTALLEAVESKAHQEGARRVLSINLIVGERSGLVAESLQFYFDLLSPETLAAGAAINFRRTSMRFHCEGCGYDYAPGLAEFSCPTCGVLGAL